MGTTPGYLSVVGIWHTDLFHAIIPQILWKFPQY